MLLEDLLPGPVLLDGALGTELQRAGLAPGECPEAWNLRHPERVEAVARAYVEAGCEIVLTNTFGANRVMLARHGLEAEVGAINRGGVAAARRAAGDRARVFASLGPTGKLLGLGQITDAELREVYGEQARILAEAGVDGLALETFSDLDEVAPAIAAAKATGLVVVATMVFDSGRDHDRTMMGTTPEAAARGMAAAGADVVGANCGRGVAGYLRVTERMRNAVDLPLWIKPNAGLPELVDGRPVYRATEREFAEGVRALVAAGARFVGGCCGTSPAHLRAAAAILRQARAERP